MYVCEKGLAFLISHLTRQRHFSGPLFIVRGHAMTWAGSGRDLGPVYMVSGGRANFSLISLKNSTDCLHENANSSRGGGGGGGGGARQLGWASCLASAGRVTLSGGTTFSHINTLARLPEARWLKLFPEPVILSNM